jgi:hypothetical protein
MSKKVLIVVLIVVGLVLLGGGFAAGRYFQKKNDKTQKESVSATPTTTVSAIRTTTKTAATTKSVTSGTSTSASPTGLSSYRSYSLKYDIQYPSEAKIENASGSESEQGKELKDAQCIKISTDNYYVIIGPKPDETNPIECFRTGVGTEWGNGPSDTITAAGMEYTANGMHTESASAGYYQDFFSISPVDGRVMIEYGTSVNEKYGTITKAEAKQKVHSIIATYSPAE